MQHFIGRVMAILARSQAVRNLSRAVWRLTQLPRIQKPRLAVRESGFFLWEFYMNTSYTMLDAELNGMIMWLADSFAYEHACCTNHLGLLASKEII